MKKYLIYIPAYNEEENIEKAIDAILNEYPEKKKSDYEIDILIVDDGSMDRTYEICSLKNVLLLKHNYNMGLGRATYSALKFANDKNYAGAIKFDADLQHRPEDIDKVIKPLKENTADIVYGSRFKGKITYRMPMIRFLGNKFFSWLMRFLTHWPISDAQTGLIGVSNNYLKVTNLMGDYNPPQQILIDAYIKKMRYIEVPVSFDKRTGGKSFISLKYPVKVFGIILKMFIYLNPIKVFCSFGALLILLGLIIGVYVFTKVWLYGVTPIVDDGTITVLIVSGIQFILFGLLADILIHRK